MVAFAGLMKIGSVLTMHRKFFISNGALVSDDRHFSMDFQGRDVRKCAWHESQDDDDGLRPVVRPGLIQESEREPRSMLRGYRQGNDGSRLSFGIHVIRGLGE